MSNLSVQLRSLNDQLQDLVGLSITEDTLPEVKVIEKKGLLRSLVDKARGYGMGAGADRESRTISLEADADNRDVLHELTHILHWDLQDEEGIDEETDGLIALVRQAWEEGVAVSVELEYVARDLMKTRGVLIRPKQIAQESLNVFSDYYKQGEAYDAAIDRFTELAEAVQRMAVAQEATTKEDRKAIGAKQLIADIKTISTSKEAIYDIGYHFVIDAVRTLVQEGQTYQQAIAWIMSHPPVSVSEITA